MRYLIVSALAVALAGPAFAQTSDDSSPHSDPEARALKKPSTSDPAANVNTPRTDDDDVDDDDDASTGASSGEAGRELRDEDDERRDRDD
jgi:hypothetical protein